MIKCRVFTSLVVCFDTLLLSFCVIVGFVCRKHEVDEMIMSSKKWEKRRKNLTWKWCTFFFFV